MIDERTLQQFERFLEWCREQRKQGHDESEVDNPTGADVEKNKHVSQKNWG